MKDTDADNIRWKGCKNMANRPVYITMDDSPFYKRADTEFTFYSGFSPEQKRLSIRSLHDSYRSSHPDVRILEVSSKSEIDLGRQLSAFNLTFTTNKGRRVSVESAFQGSKVFEKGGPYIDLYNAPSVEAKKDPRIRYSGNVTGFSFFGFNFETEPKTFFYNWLYINTLKCRGDLWDELMEYNAFTDIEFNPQRSINCQAEAVAIFVSLKKHGLLEEAASNKDRFKNIVYGAV